MIYRNPLGIPSQTEKALWDDQPALKSFTIQLLQVFKSLPCLKIYKFDHSWNL